MFKRTDDAVVTEMANNMEQETYPRRSVVMRKGEVCQNLHFIYAGYAETVRFANKPPHSSYPGEPVIVDEVDFTSFAKIERGEIFGESGFIAAMGIEEAGFTSKRNTLDIEHHDTIAGTMMEVLILKPKHFHLIDKFTRPKILTGYQSKVNWRNERIFSLKKESSRVKKIKKSMSTEGAAIAAAVTEGMNTKNTSETGTRRGGLIYRAVPPSTWLYPRLRTLRGSSVRARDAQYVCSASSGQHCIRHGYHLWYWW